MEGLAAFGVAFALVALLELGDKTQLMVISLATKHPPLPVAAGSSVGEIAVTAIGVAIGVAIAAFVPVIAVQILSGLLFVVFGVLTLRKKDEDVAVAEPLGTRSAFLTALGLAFVAELGDKTMLAVIALSASLQAPVSVFLGASAGLVAITVVSVALGRLLKRYVTARWLRLVSAGLFIVAGILAIAEAVLRL